MRHRLFRTDCNGKGRAASSHRFTSSILKLLDYTRRGPSAERKGMGGGGGGGQERSTTEVGKENDFYSFQEVKHCEFKRKATKEPVPKFKVFFFIVSRRRNLSRSC